MHKVYFVGCGLVGDSDLIAVKGKKLIRKADIVVYSGSVIPALILGLCKKEAKLYMPQLVRKEIFEFLKKKAQKKDKVVVRLHGGGPTIYGVI